MVPIDEVIINRSQRDHLRVHVICRCEGQLQGGGCCDFHLGLFCVSDLNYHIPRGLRPQIERQ